MDQHHSVPMSRQRGGNGRDASRRGAPMMAASMPPLQRGSMPARPWRGFLAGFADLLRGRGEAAAEGPATLPWQLAARRRRRLFLALIVLVTTSVSLLLAQTRPASPYPLLQLAQTGLFALLFAWVTAGCLTAVMGFWVFLRGDRHMMSPQMLARAQGGRQALDRGARTAIVMPICNEDVATVSAGLRATCESLAATGAGDLFDVYLISDTTDPDLRAAEVAAWSELRETLGSDRVFYRWRLLRGKRKAGNVADFCRRWGRGYRYMIVLDADSVMSGDCLLTLVRLMEANPQAGILQTAPQACGHDTLHARGQQFAMRVPGRLFTLGMQFWQLGEAHYWGHNAILRVEPFMRHCGLAPLPGKGGLSGDIMSHDFVEAALMRRAGYHVWLVPDLQGSYEQAPPHLLAELQRDRRWCQGNLQNARLLAEPGLHGVHRAMLLTGAMAYVSAPLWLLYISLGLLAWGLAGQSPAAAAHAAVMPLLWGITLAMLFLPRVLSVLAVRIKGEQRFYGGLPRLIQSAVLEAGMSVLQAPLRMIAHSLFVLAALSGWQLAWVSPPREAQSVSWREAAARFARPGLLALAAAAVLAWWQPAALVWLLPVIVPVLLAVPFTVFTSRSDLGRRARAARLLMIPEESWTPAVLRRAGEHAREPRDLPGWQDVLASARLCALVCAAMGSRRTSRGTRGRARRQQIGSLATSGGQPAQHDRMRFLSEPNSLQQLRAAMLFPPPLEPEPVGVEARQAMA